MTRVTRSAFTLVELMITIAILGILVMAVLPSFQSNEPIQLIAASAIVTSDIEYAQTQTIGNPSDPTTVQFDPVAEQYWLALKSSPTVPILRPDDGEPYVVTWGMDGDELLQGTTVDTVGFVESNVIEFDGFGRLVQLSDLGVKVTNGSGDLYVNVISNTGSVHIKDAAP